MIYFVLHGQKIEITRAMCEASAAGFGPMLWINNTIRDLMRAGF